MPTSTTYFSQVTVFVLDLEGVLPEGYVKLHYIVTLLFLITLQGSVCVHMPGEVSVFNTYCSALCCSYTPNVIEICGQFSNLQQKQLAYFLWTQYRCKAIYCELVVTWT